MIALEGSEPAAESVRELVARYHRGVLDLAIPAIAASERQSGGKYLEKFDEFRQRLAQLGLGEVSLIEPIAYWNISFYGHGLLADEPMVELERKIQAILHPNIEFTLSEYCEARGLPVDTAQPDPKWRNAKCDVQAMWSHIWRKRDVFVTSDNNFLKRTKMPGLVELGAGSIVTPGTAAELAAAT